MKIGFISYTDPHDRRAFSGTCYKMFENLANIGDVEWIPVSTRKSWKITRLPLALYNRMFPHKRIDWEHTRIGSFLKHKRLKTAVLKKYDVLAAYFCSNILNRKLPSFTIYLSDATFPAMVDYYPGFTDLCKWSIRQGTEIERRAMENADAIVHASEWARNSAINSLGMKPAKVYIAELGANIDDADISYRERDPGSGTLHILFLGVDWERKGGRKALDVCELLLADGIDVQLHIVGIKELDDYVQALPYVRFHGFLDKNNASDYSRLTDIINTCHCLLLPTIAECAGIAFVEAAAYGLPSFTHATGGTPNYVKNDINGFLLPLDSSPRLFADVIGNTYRNFDFPRLSRSARELYEKSINWKQWTDKVRLCLPTCLAQ